MVLTHHFVAFDAQIDVLGLDLVEQSEYSVPTNDLAIEVVRLEGFELGKAIPLIKIDVLFLDESLEFFGLRVFGCSIWLLVLAFLTRFDPEHIEAIVIRINHL